MLSKAGLLPGMMHDGYDYHDITFIAFVLTAGRDYNGTGSGQGGLGGPEAAGTSEKKKGGASKSMDMASVWISPLVVVVLLVFA